MDQFIPDQSVPPSRPLTALHPIPRSKTTKAHLFTVFSVSLIMLIGLQIGTRLVSTPQNIQNKAYEQNPDITGKVCTSDADCLDGFKCSPVCPSYTLHTKNQVCYQEKWQHACNRSYP